MAGSEQRVEGGVVVPPSVPTEDELVQIGLDVDILKAVVDASRFKFEKTRWIHGSSTWAAILPTTFGAVITHPLAPWLVR